ncbi:MAG: glycosyltransferase family 39 protein [Burkholderiaceae bacterium]|nr:glycosyltransferase family 39 protein [Burkholderiaceae bacterium]
MPWLIALAAVHITIRVTISPALKWDEAQQILWTQQLQWGYGAQPPLYTWVQWCVNQLLGPCVLALSLVKHTFIALTCVLMWLAARELMGRRAAWWSAASLWLLLPFGWFSVRDQTHTVLVTAMTCGAWWLLLRIVRRAGSGCQREFAALGLMCGCGMLSKYSFALAAAALIAAFLSVRGPRRALLGRGWWWTPLIGLIVVAPHGWWLLSHWHDATAGTIREMTIAPRHNWGAGLVSLIAAVLGMLAPWALLTLAAFGPAWWRRPDPAPEIPGWPASWLRRVFGRYLALIALALLFMVFAADVTVFKGRWVLPLLVPVPLMAFALRPELDADRRGKRFTAVALALILVIVIAAGTRPWLAAIDGGVDELNHPAVQLAQALREAGYNGRGRIIAADHMLAGMLRTRFPGAPAAACYPDDGGVADCVASNVQVAGRAGQGWLIISRADRIEPDWWNLALSHIPGSDSLPRGNLRIPFRMVRRDHPLASYDFVWHPPQPPAQP